MMRNIIRIYLLFISLSASAIPDSTSVRIDSSHVEIRQFDSVQIDEHKADSDFDYGNKVEAELTLWQRFKIWLNGILMRLLQFSTNTTLGKILVYVLIIAGIVYAIYKLTTIHSRKLFTSQNSSGLGYEVHHEDIHQMDFDKLIEEAINKNDYRLAIRLIYLYALKHLADRQLIDWQPGKTNHDYSTELTDKSLKPGFINLSYYFDYAWYGDFSVNQTLFNKVNATFAEWKKELKA